MLKTTFTSKWDDGSVVKTPCEYNPETGEVTAESVDFEPDAALVQEYISLPDEDEIPVCTTCHEYTMRVVVGDRADESYGEYLECRNPDCDGEAA